MNLGTDNTLRMDWDDSFADTTFENYIPELDEVFHSEGSESLANKRCYFNSEANA
jgi:hypothetical protein